MLYLYVITFQVGCRRHQIDCQCHLLVLCFRLVGLLHHLVVGLGTEDDLVVALYFHLEDRRVLEEDLCYLLEVLVLVVDLFRCLVVVPYLMELLLLVHFFWP